ncbi:MAG: hypothetical protein M1594_00810 [Candidatus Marsarchaeota archaeon]|nr:hypothetical protein [Candidatus Marsarchaeota archaeon]
MAIKTSWEVKLMMLLEKLGIAKPVENTYNFNQAMNEHAMVIPDLMINLILVLGGFYLLLSQSSLFLPIAGIAVFYFGSDFLIKNIK